MKRLLLLVMVLMPLICFGAKPPTEANKSVRCFDTQEAFQDLEKHLKQNPTFISPNELTNYKSMIAFFESKETGEWTLIEFDKEYVCVLAMGRNKSI